MATVKLTNELRDEIKKAASNLFAKRIAETEGNVSDFATQGDRILDAYLDASPTRRAAFAAVIAEGWTREASAVELHFPGVNGYINLAIANRPIMNDWGTQYGSIGLRVRMSDIQSSAYLLDLHTRNAERRKAHEAVKAERDAYVDQVKKVISAASTLKQALSLWSGLWDLVPQDARDRHNAVTVRGTRKTDENGEEIVIDVDALNTGLVVAKMVEGAI